jgi:uncharacterized protein YpiB (UPF0302 family)
MASESEKIKANYLSMFKSDGGQHLYRKMKEMEQSSIERAIATDNKDEALHAIYEARGIRKLRTYIDLATDNKFNS